MLTTELRFLLFLAVVYAVYWFALARNSWRKTWLLLASYGFYAAWDWRFLGLLLVTSSNDFAAGRAMARWPQRRRIFLIGALIVDLGILGFFKYYGFFIHSMTQFLGIFEVTANLPLLKIILPVGISFFTFRAMSYSIDVYRGKLTPSRSPLDFALFVAFFPQLLAGPIATASSFLPQMGKAHRLAQVPFRRVSLLFLLGFVKKAVVADTIAPLVDMVFTQPGSTDWVSGTVAILLYTLQIYCDFSGYSDMAIAVTWLFGFEAPENFRAPYFSPNVQEFWRRWHISLSSWLRDYLYFPLGGNRQGRWRQRLNLMLTMLLGGLWHGANWTYVVWGGLHGAALVVHRFCTQRRSADGFSGVTRRVFAICTTFVFVSLCWVFFRADSIQAAVNLLARVFTFASASGPGVQPAWLLLLLLLPLDARATRILTDRDAVPCRRLPAWTLAVLLGVAVASLLLFMPRSTRPFIYFQY